MHLKEKILKDATIALTGTIVDIRDSSNILIQIGGERVHLSVDLLDAVGSLDPDVIAAIRTDAEGRAAARTEEERTRPRVGEPRKQPA